MAEKKSQFTTVETVVDDRYFNVFGQNTDEKISKPDLFNQIQEELYSPFIYPTVELLQAADLEADEDFPTYVRVEENQYKLYKITSLAAGVDDITLNNGATATFQVEYRDIGFVVGPASSTTGALAVFSDASGSILDDTVVPTATGRALITASETVTKGYFSKDTDNTVDVLQAQPFFDEIKQFAGSGYAGTIKKSTTASVITGAADDEAITPLTLQALTATETRDGLIEIATRTEGIDGLDQFRAMTPYTTSEALAARATTVVKTFADLATTPMDIGQIVMTKEYQSGIGIGGCSYVGVSGSLTYAGLESSTGTVGVFARPILSNPQAEHFGVKGDGVDDTVAINNFRVYCQATGKKMGFGEGIFVVSDTSAVTFSTAVNIEGQGQGKTIIKAKNSAAMAEFVAFVAASGKFTIKNLTIDGNRNNGGIGASGGYCLYLSGYDALIENVEIRDSGFAGAFTGSAGGTAHNHTFKSCWIHSNGATTSGGNGVGIFGGGSTPTTMVTVENCTIEYNYCIDTLPGDSTAINAQAYSFVITGNEIRNNYNVNGGQLVVTSGGSGSGKINAIITENVINQTGTFGGELTCGIEVNGTDFVISDNIIMAATVDAIRIEGDSSRGVVSNNICYAGASTGTGINIITSGGTGGSKITLDNNQILTGFNGISLQSGYTEVYATNNIIATAVTNKVAGESNFNELRGNKGYAPASPDETAGASPWTSTAYNWDVLVVLKTPNGISALTFGGASLPITAGTSFFLKARRQFVATWSGSAPVFSFIQQQR